MEEAEQLCDYIIIMDHGKILKEGTLDQLLTDERGKKVVEFTLKGVSIRADIFKNHAPFAIDWNEELNRGSIELSQLDKDLPVFFEFLKQKQLELNDMISRRVTLDDLFISLTGRHLHG